MIAIYLPTTDHFFQLDLTDTIWTLDYVNTARHIASHEFFQPTVHIRTVRPWLLLRFGILDSFLPCWSDLKSVILQYNTLVCWADEKRDSLTKLLMFRVSFFFIKSCKIFCKNPINLSLYFCKSPTFGKS